MKPQTRGEMSHEILTRLLKASAADLLNSARNAAIILLFFTARHPREPMNVYLPAQSLPVDLHSK